MKTQITFLITFLIMFSTTGCKEIELPDIEIGNLKLKDVQEGINFGSQIYNAYQDITPEQEYYIGRSVSATILDKYKIYNNTKLTQYVNTIGQLLLLNSSQPEIFAGYHFSILDSDEVNAFATPGGFIFITRGMIKVCKSEDQLASVLAHEIAHVQLKHGIKSIKDSRWTSIATKIGTEVAKKHTSEELAQLSSAFTHSIDDVVNTLVVNGYSRAYENDADKYAVDILLKTSYSDSAIVSMLQEMDVRLKFDTRGFGSTHPKASERIDTLHETHKFHVQPLLFRTKRFKYYLKYV